jgi:hypothetical protein
VKTAGQDGRLEVKEIGELVEEALVVRPAPEKALR